MIETLLGLEPAVFGFAGVVAGAAVVFFAFIGFDVVATTAEETRNPQRDLPIGILSSLAIVTVLYMRVSLVITGMQNYTEIDPESGSPLSDAFDAVGVDWMAQHHRGRRLHRPGGRGDDPDARADPGRVRDGPRRPAAHRRWPRCTRSSARPTSSPLIVGVAVAVLAGFVAARHADRPGQHRHPVRLRAGEHRRGDPAPHPARPAPRSFRVPAAPLVATLAVLSCVYLMLNLPGETWLRFVIWMALGFVVYFAYGYRHSRVGAAAEQRRHAERGSESVAQGRIGAPSAPRCGMLGACSVLGATR